MNVVERQLKAYNEKNIDAFMECYSEDIQVYKFPNTLRFSKKEEMREHYDKMFQAFPNLNADVVKRVEQAPYCIDHEYITGKEKEPFHATALYEIKDDIITKVWFL
ncbi:nuclear transport factor 2 family protein [Cytobacillus sp. FJAT-54145]|uniref:Nuclear transport factor 2 family protein n=1 Tax=Cytobacillus spartinae TaxID=3299023 RepID=A0ABW6KJU6_9BACI